MKWGVRRYQNKDGSLTPAGKRRANTGEASNKPSAKERAKNFVSEHKTGIKRAVVIAGAAAAVAGIRKLKKMKVTEADAGKFKSYVQTGAKALDRGVKDGVKEGLTSGMKKSTTTVIVGASMLGTKKLMDMYVGKDIAGQIFNANNSKKIGSFWNYKEDDDDDD